MKLYLNSNKEENQVTWNKADYLLAAADRLGMTDVLPYTEGVDAECVLNIEPFNHFVQGSHWTGVWEIDVLCDRQEMNLSNWVASDNVFVAVGQIPKRMQGFEDKITLFFQACDPIIHKRIETISQDFDFVFSGSVGLGLYEERERLIDLLRQNDFTFVDFGKGNNPIGYVKNINKAKVQFIRSMKTNIGDGELAQRFFECLAIGPVLTNYAPDLKQVGLIEGQDYMSYKNDKELLAKMHKLIDNPDLRDSIAKNGRQKALLYHTYDVRLTAILNIIKEKNG